MGNKFTDLLIKQRLTRSRNTDFTQMEASELQAIRKLAYRLFGDANTRYSMPGGKFRYGGLLEVGPEEPGIVYVGYYLDPPGPVPAKRRRRLLFFGASCAEIEAQAKLRLS